MTIPEHIGLWGSIASIIGLVIAFVYVVRNRERIKKLEQVFDLDIEAQAESRSRAAAEAKGGNQTAKQSIGPISQSVGASGQRGLHRTSCPYLPDGRNEVDASIAQTGVVQHVVCSELEQDYSCKTQANRGRNCCVINPAVIEQRRNALRARRDGLVG